MNQQERCDRCGQFVRECTLLADTENNESICAPCWSVVYSPTTSDKPPDRREFTRRMKAAGWKRRQGPGYGWEHPPTGTTWEGDNYTQEQGIAWIDYCKRGETPPTNGDAL